MEKVDPSTVSKPVAYDSYQELAEHYAAAIDTKPHNAFYDRPAMISLWPDVRGLRVLDAGCGPGVYAELLAQRGAIVTAVDVSDKMLELARKRLGATADLRLVDLSQPLPMFPSQSFDFINAPLCVASPGVFMCPGQAVISWWLWPPRIRGQEQGFDRLFAHRTAWPLLSIHRRSFGDGIHP